MGKLEKFVIEFVADKKNKAKKCYFAGETINGIVFVELSQPMEIRRKHDVTVASFLLVRSNVIHCD
jgi:hypothetical protein